MPWGVLLSVLLKLMGWILDKRSADKAAKEAFLLFVDSLNTTSLASVSLNDSDREQVEELKRRRHLLQGGNDASN